MSSLRCGNGHDPTSLISANNKEGGTTIIVTHKCFHSRHLLSVEDFEDAYPSIDCLDYSTPTLIDNPFIPN